MHVLVVDDSALVRQTVSALLADEDDVSVTVAADPLIAMQKIAARRPDVILLDIEMPHMDGLTFLGKLMRENPIPVVICSAFADSGRALRALQSGAIDVVAKPKIGVREFLTDSRVQLADALRAAAIARIGRAVAPTLVSARVNRQETLSAADDSRIVVIGASTGGTEALRAIVSALPANAPGMLIVQHMPEGFTRQFAAQLDASAAIDVREAANGDRVRRGLALVAPGNRHLSIRRDGDGYAAVVDDGPLVSRHRPSVDVLFRSAAEAAGANATAVILTGMGDDGARGMAALRRAGAFTIAQDEKSCVVFGMPKEAIARNAVDEVLPLDRIATAILRHVARTV